MMYEVTNIVSSAEGQEKGSSSTIQQCVEIYSWLRGTIRFLHQRLYKPYKVELRPRILENPQDSPLTLVPPVDDPVVQKEGREQKIFLPKPDHCLIPELKEEEWKLQKSTKANAQLISTQKDEQKERERVLQVTPQLPVLHSLTYSMYQNPHGLAVILGNETFHYNPQRPKLQLKNHKGCDHLFSLLNYEVTAHKDLSAADIEELLEEISSMDHSMYDSFVMCITSHGESNNYIFGSDSKSLNIYELIHKIQACWSLKNKPKLVFIQASRDTLEGMVSEDSERKTSLEYSAAADLYIAWATSRDQPAYSSHIKGSWFVSALRHVFAAQASTADLVTMMYKVTDMVSSAKGQEKGSSAIVQQCVETCSWLKRAVRFFPVEIYVKPLQEESDIRHLPFIPVPLVDSLVGQIEGREQISKPDKRLLPELKEEEQMPQESTMYQQQVIEELIQPPGKGGLQITPQPPAQQPNFTEGLTYPMDQNPHGMAIVLGNETFHNNPKRSELELSNHKGCDVDIENFKHLFSLLNYDVTVHKDVSAADIEDLFEKISSMDHSMYDSFVICITSHGESNNYIFGSDSESLDIYQLIRKIQGCLSLHNKPKLFFIQTCSGMKASLAYNSEADVYIAWATSLDQLSPSGGSWFVSALRHVFAAKAPVADLETMMCEVKDITTFAKGHEKGSSSTVQQCIEINSQLRGAVWFFSPQQPQKVTAEID